MKGQSILIITGVPFSLAAALFTQDQPILQNKGDFAWLPMTCDQRC